MTVYDDVDLEDMSWDSELESYTYECPCGDLFQISKDELRAGEEIARCPACTLGVRVIYDADDFAPGCESDDDGNATPTPAPMLPPKVRCVRPDEHDD